MICIDAENLRDGLYNIKDGKIFKYKAKGGTVRAYDMRSIVRCKECMWAEVDSEAEMYRCHRYSVIIWNKGDHFCAWGEREDDAPLPMYDSLKDYEFDKAIESLESRRGDSR